MYDPKGNSKERIAQAVIFEEREPPAHLRDIVHRYLELKTAAPLAGDYRFHALPDACTYAVFDQRDRQVAGIARLQASSEELNLGRAFHYVNIRFLPGVWQQDRLPAAYGMVDAPYGGDLPLREINAALAGRDFDEAQPVLTDFVQRLLAEGMVVASPMTQKIFGRIDDIHTVADMAEMAGMSARQLQRTLKRVTGLAPHDFLKVLRLQQALRGEPSLSYADQSHFIHSFRRATGYTPGQYAKKFDV